MSFGRSDAVDSLPGVLSGPLSQPLFVLGTVFILAVYFFPGGLAGLRDPARPTRQVDPRPPLGGSTCSLEAPIDSISFESIGVFFVW